MKFWLGFDFIQRRKGDREKGSWGGAGATGHGVKNKEKNELNKRKNW